jgi:hypothetical protein
VEIVQLSHDRHDLASHNRQELTSLFIITIHVYNICVSISQTQTLTAGFSPSQNTHRQASQMSHFPTHQGTVISPRHPRRDHSIPIPRHTSPGIFLFSDPTSEPWPAAVDAPMLHLNALPTRSHVDTHARHTTEGFSFRCSSLRST